MGQRVAKHCDILVIGGGINGCGVARDAAGRGWSVILCEMNDLASGTSSWSTKLIHGGLRYLEYWEFRLVREALMEREVLWRLAPHIIRPLRFVLPHHNGLRPAWLLRLGLFLYDHLGGRKKLPATRTLDLRHDAAGEPLNGQYVRGFEYSDCWVDDARLVVLNARSAAEKGAEIRTRTKVTGLERQGDRWQVTMSGPGGEETVSTRLVVNAAGPWVDRVLESSAHVEGAHIRLVQGSHIVVRRLYDHDRAYIFQNSDGRIVFAIPYERDFTLIGTTDRDYVGEPGEVEISEEEVDYLCHAASEYFRKAVTPDDVVWTYSGVRPLVDDGATPAQAATRDYTLKGEGGRGEAHLVNIFGGKITTYRRLAEAVMEKIEQALEERRGRPWTATEVLPGGDFPVDGSEGLTSELSRTHPGLPHDLLARLARAYGTDARTILTGVDSLEDMGRDYGAGLTAREVDWLQDKEWALTADDIVWRRSKLGLRMSAEQIAALEESLQGEGEARGRASAVAG